VCSVFLMPLLTLPVTCRNDLTFSSSSPRTEFLVEFAQSDTGNDGQIDVIRGIDDPGFDAGYRTTAVVDEVIAKVDLNRVVLGACFDNSAQTSHVHNLDPEGDSAPLA